MTDPILVNCEGSGHAGHLHNTEHLMLCAMCGQKYPPEQDVLGDGVMPEHQRRDLIAMIKRGDFDG